MYKSKMKIRDMAYIALMVVLIAVCSWINIPSAVPFTLQTFGVFCALELLGGKRGTVAIGVYIIMGAIGLPVFSGFTGGIGKLLGSTGGYILGFLLTGLTYWLIERLFGSRIWASILSFVLGLALCYAFGTAWFMTVYAKTTGAIGLGSALAWCVLPFLIPDGIKMALALTLARMLKKHIHIEPQAAK